MKTVALVEATICDHPDYECYADLFEHFSTAVDHYTTEAQNMYGDEDVEVKRDDENERATIICCGEPAYHIHMVELK